MPPFRPVKRKELIKALREAGFEGPYVGGRHEFLVKGQLRLILPNPHQSDISTHSTPGRSHTRRVGKTVKRTYHKTEE